MQQQNRQAGAHPKSCLRNLGGLWLGKTLTAAIRLGGKGGTTLPGRAASLLSPGLLPALAARLPLGSYIVTGTNGKTTTASLLTGILRQDGYRVLHNRSGSNLAWGVASAFLQAGSWSGRLHDQVGVIEADEGAFPEISGALAPRGVVLTNIFRDQLDRYGEVDRIRASLQKGLAALPGGSLAILNADDPAVASLAHGQEKRLRLLYYGLALNSTAVPSLLTGRDLMPCPLCGKQLTYSAVYLVHLGRYRCLSCRFRRPEPEVELTGRIPQSRADTEIAIKIPGDKISLKYPLPGLFNLYNALAATACAAGLGVPRPALIRGLEQASPSFGRMEHLQIQGRPVMMGLVKNAAGANEVLRTFLEDPGRLQLLIAINDNYADGTDISWLWDVDFEQLEQAGHRLAGLTVSGIRAADMALRLKYAGIGQERITVEPHLKAALARSLAEAGGDVTLYILPSYTAMLQLRKMISKAGAARPYWEE